MGYQWLWLPEGQDGVSDMSWGTAGAVKWHASGSQKISRGWKQAVGRLACPAEAPGHCQQRLHFPGTIQHSIWQLRLGGLRLLPPRVLGEQS